MKGMTGKLPPIMRDYCDFIFSIGEKTQIMAKLVSDYTQVILKGIDEAEAELSKIFKSKSPIAADGTLVEKANKNDDPNKILDILYRLAVSSLMSTCGAADALPANRTTRKPNKTIRPNTVPKRTLRFLFFTRVPPPVSSSPITLGAVQK